jgi:hypothetical protein
MDLSASALTGALRVGVQIIVNRKRPVLEIYQNVHNEFGPPFQYDIRDSTNTKVLKTEKHRFQDISIDLSMVNLGGVRAENVSFEISGSFRRDTPLEKMPALFQSIIRQVAPGQMLHLLRIRPHDLNEYEPENPDNPVAFKSIGLKKDTLTITVHYDAPGTLLNWLPRWWRSLRGLKQFAADFTFDPMMFDGYELPPAKYNG